VHQVFLALFLTEAYSNIRYIANIFMIQKIAHAGTFPPPPC